jgi:hypothetical protein
MRYTGVDLQTTNFVVCFLDTQDRLTLQMFALSPKGLAAFKRRVTSQDRIAAEASPGVNFFYAQVHTDLSGFAPKRQSIIICGAPYERKLPISGREIEFWREF